MGNIFISYRRKDWAFAQRLAEHLDARMPSAHVFIDANIRGVDFEEIILKEIADCDVFILVVSERTFEKSRINNPEDWIRREIREALHLKKPIILAAIEECNIPNDLPDEISTISRRHATIFYPQFFTTAVYELAERCRLIASAAFSVEEGTGIQVAKPATVEQTGIVTTYDKLDQCREAMKQDFLNSSNVRLLLQLGRKELGSGTNSFFYDIAKQKTYTHAHSLRILRAGSQSPFLSENRAKRRKSQTTYEEWLNAIEQIEKQIAFLKKYGVPVEARVHEEPFLWRLFIFDEIAYVSGYLFHSQNDEKAVVHKIQKGTNSLFGVFDTYFEYLWKKYDPHDTRSIDEKWVEW